MPTWAAWILVVAGLTVGTSLLASWWREANSEDDE